MSVKCVYDDFGDVKIAVLRGNLETSGDVDAVFDGTPRRLNFKLLVNMKYVKLVEPVAVRRLDARRRLVEENGGEVRLLNVERIRNPQTLGALGLICPIHSNETEAIRSFR
jgi:hypothetical protein